MNIETCDWKGCDNQAYREVDYFKDRKLRQKVAEKLRTLSDGDVANYVQKLFKIREMSWSFLCRKHFEQERDANHIIGWCRVLSESSSKST